ncbi:hypothetical protein AG1IA_01163 [Rhizoctonia solani AG-1 IA]|uniref:Uncharacterized protein n=1 Tax=Thanatephorus cucumeris (strain AG1-IA) TaxID=983506 RepID=L8X3Q4_THACA|nr:hypothetical protein AG1IA_01163 [Rhizoctonia solani AG-1 IA]
MSVSGEITRIALNGIDDWNRIQEEFDSNVLDILNSTLAAGEPISAEDKEMLLKCLKDWQKEAFDTAKPNISVNGQDLENYVPEPYDELLNGRRQASTEEQLVWDKTLADRRRKAPREVERVVEDLLLRQRMAIPVSVPLRPPVPREIEGMSPVLLGLLVPNFRTEVPRWEDVVETHKETAAIAVKLGKEPTLMQRAQRAKKVGQTIASLPSHALKWPPMLNNSFRAI